MAEQLGPPEHGYNIGAVVRLTGVPADTLRVWERRYGTVDPGRGPRNQRQYSYQDVQRLLLIKGLVDRGQPISQVANLGEDELRRRTSELEQVAESDGAAAGPVRVGVLGPRTAAVLNASVVVELTGQIEVQEFTDAADIASADDDQFDVLVIERDTLQARDLTALRDIVRSVSPCPVLLLYGFAAQPVLARLRQGGVETMRSPVRIEELVDRCRALGRRVRPRGDLEVLFDPATLARIAGMSSTVACECPQHLADLVQRLGAFERYSAECEDLDTEDAALHAWLYDTTRRVRRTVEEALLRVVEAEGIDPGSAMARSRDT